MPEVSTDVLERLALEVGWDRNWLEAAPIDGEAAAKVVNGAARSLAEQRREDNLKSWFLNAIWIVATTLVALYAHKENPVESWYEWPIVWVAAGFLVGVASLPLYFVTIFLHDWWWDRFGPGRA